jgi:tryptophan-specific transport protein
MKFDQKEGSNSLSKPLWHGVVLVAGGAVGAGMFALPLISAGAWFLWSSLGLGVVCLFTYMAASLLVDVNVKYPAGSSFDTLVGDILGRPWSALNNISIAFIMFVLMYAYITAGAGILAHSMEALFGSTFEQSRPILSLVFASSVAFFIWFGTSAVSRVSTLLMVAMCASFVTANSALITTAEFSELLTQPSANIEYLWSAIPVFVTALACAGLVPSLSNHYENKPSEIRLSILLGLLLALVVYLVWLTSTLGNISRDNFVSVASDGGGLNALVRTLQQGTDNSLTRFSLTWFSHFAVATSFLSIGLGLVDFLIDRFNFKVNSLGRAKSVCLAFLPPLVASAVAPYGFVSAIGYAGFFVAFSFFIVPALMFRKIAIRQARIVSRKWLAVLIFGLLVMLLKLLNSWALLPSYP